MTNTQIDSDPLSTTQQTYLAAVRQLSTQGLTVRSAQSLLEVALMVSGLPMAGLNIWPSGPQAWAGQAELTQTIAQAPFAWPAGHADFPDAEPRVWSVEQAPEPLQEALRRAQMQALVMCPVQVAGQNVGVLWLVAPETPEISPQMAYWLELILHQLHVVLSQGQENDTLAVQNQELLVQVRQLRAILASMRDGVILMDTSGTVHEFNAAAEMIL
ncbi:MAG: hypothetical protein ACLFTK_09015, partial [Anaerolineales bacterium]